MFHFCSRGRGGADIDSLAYSIMDNFMKIFLLMKMSFHENIFFNYEVYVLDVILIRHRCTYSFFEYAKKKGGHDWLLYFVT